MKKSEAGQCSPLQAWYPPYYFPSLDTSQPRGPSPRIGGSRPGPQDSALDVTRGGPGADPPNTSPILNHCNRRGPPNRAPRQSAPAPVVPTVRQTGKNPRPARRRAVRGQEPVLRCQVCPTPRRIEESTRNPSGPSPARMPPLVERNGCPPARCFGCSLTFGEYAYRELHLARMCMG